MKIKTLKESYPIDSTSKWGKFLKEKNQRAEKTHYFTDWLDTFPSWQQGQIKEQIKNLEQGIRDYGMNYPKS